MLTARFMGCTESKRRSEHANLRWNLGICAGFDCVEAGDGLLPLTLGLSSSKPVMQNKCHN